MAVAIITAAVATLVRRTSSREPPSQLCAAVPPNNGFEQGKRSWTGALGPAQLVSATRMRPLTVRV